MVLIKERLTEFCALCGCENHFRICFSCIKKSAKNFDASTTFPDLGNNKLEAQIASFLLSKKQYVDSETGLSNLDSQEFIVLVTYLMLHGFPEDYFDEAAAKTALYHYMRAIFGEWYHLVSMSGLPKEGSVVQEDEEERVITKEELRALQLKVREELEQQAIFLSRIISFLKNDEVAAHIKENRVVKISTLITILDELEQRLNDIEKRKTISESNPENIIPFSEAV